MTTSVVNLFKEEYDIYIGRPSRYGNPFSVNPHSLAPFVVGSREEAIDSYREYVLDRLEDDPDWLEPLRGKRLGCFCKPKACHGDVIVELLDKEE